MVVWLQRFAFVTFLTCPDAFPESCVDNIPSSQIFGQSETVADEFVLLQGLKSIKSHAADDKGSSGSWRRRRRGLSPWRQAIRDSVDGVQDGAAQIVDDVQETGNTIVDDVQENMEDADLINSVMDSTQESANSIVDGSQEAVGSAIDTSQEVASASVDLVDDVIDTTQDLTGAGADIVQEIGNNVIDVAQETVLEDADTSNEIIDAVQEIGNDAINSVQHITGFEVDNAWTTATNAKRALHGACPVVWNQDLVDGSQGIQAWVDSLTSLVHATGIGVGENLASGSTNEEQIVDMWYNEVHDCQQLPGCGDNGVDNYMVVGHFTSLVWKDVKSIGCAISSNGRFAGCRYDTEGPCGPNCQGGYADNVGDFGEISVGCTLLTSAGALSTLTDGN